MAKRDNDDRPEVSLLFVVPSIWSASEGATPELKNFPNMLYIVGHGVLPAQLLYQAKMCQRDAQIYFYVRLERIVAK
jgi:hypothetical protein